MANAGDTTRGDDDVAGGPDCQDGPTTMPSDRTGWWETERAKFVRSRILDLTDAGNTIVDVGCGRGDMFDSETLASRTCINVDSHGWNEWDVRSGRLFVRARADALPFRDGVFDLVGSFDVLEHLPDDARALAEQRRIAQPGAQIVAAVPADPRLWSAHDEAVGHHRRYRVDDFEHLARRADLELRWHSHFYSYLWLPAFVFRKSPVRRSEPGANNGLAAVLVARCIAAVASLERFFLRRRWKLPIGTSLWCELSGPGSGSHVGGDDE